MNILLFGVSNVGKTSIGTELAKNLNYDFFDLDLEIKKTYQVTLEQFLNNNPDHLKRDQIKTNLLKNIIKRANNSVIAVNPFNYYQCLKPLLDNKNVLAIELKDTPENIFNRLVFSDENDEIYDDSDEYKNKHKYHYLDEIVSDIYYYCKVYKDIEAKYFINGKSIKEAADELTDLIVNNQPIKITLSYDDLIDAIMLGYDEVIYLYNIITHQIVVYDENKRISTTVDDIIYNQEIFLQLPNYEDFNELEVLDDFIDNLNDKNIKTRFIELTKDLDHDFYDDLITLGINKQWDDYSSEKFDDFLDNWCKQNNIEYK